MDPVTALGLAATVQQLLVSTMQYGSDLKNAKKEIRVLSTEVTMLKATLEHLKIILDTSAKKEESAVKSDDPIFNTTNLATSEFEAMLKSTETILTELLGKLQPAQDSTKFTQSLKNAVRIATWTFTKKGVQDYVDRLQRAKSWFILALTTDETAYCREMFIKLCSIEKSLQIQSNQKDVESQAAILSWLSPSNQHSKLQQSLERFQEGTGDWFLKGVYYEWLTNNESSRILWFKAKPGFGKTTLMAAAIDYARKVHSNSDTQAAICYHFCSFTEQKSQDTINMLGSILARICEQNPSTFEAVQQLYPRSNSSIKQNIDEPTSSDLMDSLIASPENSSGSTRSGLIDLLIQSLENFETINIVVDAVNESKDPDDLIECVWELAQKTKNFRFLLSSTEETALNIPTTGDHVGKDNSEKPVKVAFVPLEKEANQRDIKVYIEAELQRNKRLCRLPNWLKEEISSVLQKRANGVYVVFKNLD
jgi:hypothetical protein